MVEKKNIFDFEVEVSCFDEVIVCLKEEFEKIKEYVLKELGQDKVDIFFVYFLVFSDFEFLNFVKEKISIDLVNVEFVLKEMFFMFVIMFELMDNEYMKECVVDICDVIKCVIGYLFGVEILNLSMILEEVIIVVEDLILFDIV